MIRAQHSWSGSSSNPRLWLLLVVFALVWLLLGAFNTTIWPAVLITLLATIPLLLFDRARVNIDANGVAVRYGTLGLQLSHFAIAEIQRAEPIDVRPLRKWGGWGYRGSRKLFKRAGLIVRGGPGIALFLRDGTNFTVTVDEAANGAATVSQLVALAPRH